MPSAAVTRPARPGFTLIELLVVITIILLISGLFLSLSPGDGGGLPAAQRVVSTSLRTVRAMALMNRGNVGAGIPFNPRYRLLILNDPADLDGHLRTVVVAVGSVSAADAGATDPNTIATTDTRYKWLAPEDPVRLPQGVYFVPPASDSTTTVNLPPGWGAGANTRRSIIGDLADSPGASSLDVSAGPPRMTFAALNQPTPLSGMTAAMGGRTWYYVEIQPSGQSGHLGRVMLVLATGALRPGSGSGAVLDVANESQFSAVALRPSGEVSLTTGPEEMDTDLLKK
ncbi:MAG: type II secretion system protein [Opitutales bacterium]